MQVAFLMKERTQADVSWAVMSNFSLWDEEGKDSCFASSTSLPWCRTSPGGGSGVPAFPPEWSQIRVNQHPGLHRLASHCLSSRAFLRVERRHYSNQPDGVRVGIVLHKPRRDITPVPEDLKDPSNWSTWNAWRLTPPILCFLGTQGTSTSCHY